VPARARAILSGATLERVIAAAREANDPPPDAVVVVDVLRATTTLVHAFAHGADAARCFADPEQARAARAEYRKGATLLCGERRGQRIPGFDLGNSPREYVDEFVRNRTLLFTTTNGTKALVRTREALRQMAGAFVNQAAVVGRLCALAAAAPDGGPPFTAWLVAAGKEDQPADEDTACVIELARGLAAAPDGGWTVELEPGDEASVARLEHVRFADDAALAAFFAGTEHGRALLEIDHSFARDLADAARRDAFQVVPEGRGGVLSAAGR
jgi:2-phosphosulfolactate phosphatase